MKKITSVLIKSLIVNMLLTGTKIVSGLICGSRSLIADGIHSLSDLSTDIVSIFGSKMSDKPADSNHPYGHGKIEYLTSLVIGTVILVLAISLMVNAFNNEKNVMNKLVLYITIFTITSKYLIATYILKKGYKYKSSLLIASGKESKADVFSSLIVVVTYFASKMSNINPIFLYSDSIGSFIIGLVILKTSYNILKENIISILGEVENDEEYIEKIKKIILSYTDVKKIDELYIIKYGHYNQANITISLDKDISIINANVISDKLKNELISKKYNIAYVKISINAYME